MRWFSLILLGVVTASVAAENLRLAGTVMHGEGAALIEVQGRQVLVRKGETIPGQALVECRLVEVTGKAARFRCPGGAHLLTLGGLHRNPQFRDTHRQVGDTHQFRQVRQVRDTHLSGSVVSLNGQEVEEFFEDRQRLVSEIPLEPVADDTGITGYRLIVASPGGLARRVGFSPGDIVRSINGVEAGAGSAFMQMLNNLSDARQLRIGFERDGRTLEALILLD